MQTQIGPAWPQLRTACRLLQQPARPVFGRRPSQAPRCCLRSAAARPAVAACSTQTRAGCMPQQPPAACSPPLLQRAQKRQQRCVAAGAMQVDLLLGGLAGFNGWAAAAVLLVGVVAGLALAKLATSCLQQQTDPYTVTLENAELRTKIEDLQQLVIKLQPLYNKSMRMRFTKGINKTVILGMVDTMLANKEVNIWWLPDQIERLLYFNVMSLMLSILDEVVNGMSVNFAGHNVKLQLTYLDVAPGGEAGGLQAAKTAALLESALQPVKSRAQPAVAN